jgi:hypothetical protein
MLEDAVAGRIAIIVVHKLDRVARHRRVARNRRVAFEAFGRLGKVGVGLAGFSPTTWPSSPRRARPSAIGTGSTTDCCRSGW